MAAAGVEAVEDDKGAVIAEIRLSRRRWWMESGQLIVKARKVELLSTGTDSDMRVAWIHWVFICLRH